MAAVPGDAYQPLAVQNAVVAVRPSVVAREAIADIEPSILNSLVHLLSKYKNTSALLQLL